jgi:hypothetical protein
MRKLTILIALLYTLSTVLLACIPASQTAPLPPISEGAWTSNDLRWIGLGDSSDPQTDLIAAYTRRTSDELQIRLDFLTSPASLPLDVYLAVQHTRGGETDLPIQAAADVRWNDLLIFPSGSAPLHQEPGGEALSTDAAYLALGDGFDGIVLNLDSQYFLPGITFQVFLTAPGSQEMIDSSAPIALQAVPPRRAPLLLAFWDTLPAATPAQAMRRWNGAHTGPLGQRHGLYQLLRAADQYDVPLALLDLKQPASLAALDLMGQLDWLKYLDERRLLILPDTMTGDPDAQEYSLSLSRKTGERYGLAESHFLFGAISNPAPAVYSSGFYTGGDRILSRSDMRLVPLPGEVYRDEEPSTAGLDQVDRGGLTLFAKRKMLETALSGVSADITVFGGSLLDSLWADSAITPLAFDYIAKHPWIQPLDAAALLAIPTDTPHNNASLAAPPCPDLLCAPVILPFIPYTTAGTPVLSNLALPELRAAVRSELNTMPPGQAADLAWQMYLTLTQPTPDPFRQALQANYLGQVGHLIFLARWSADPAPLSSCGIDLDWDGEPDCVLASGDTIATFKMDGGRLLFAGRLENSQFVQWVGPASQFVSGAGESDTWQIRRGILADPDEIPGGFAPANGLYPAEAAIIDPEKIAFQSPDGDIKTYHITPKGVLVTIKTAQPYITQVPIALAANNFWSPGGPHEYKITTMDEKTLSMEIESGPGLMVSFSSTQASNASFLHSSELLKASENPDQAYPPGHFLPFPLVIIEIQVEDNFHFEIIQK